MPTRSSPTSRWVAISGALAALVLLVFHLTLRADLDARALDAQFRALRLLRPAPLDTDVVVVGIDDETFRRLPEPVALWHAHFGALFQALSAAQPAVVGVDVVMPDRSFSFLGPEYDRSLLAGVLALKRAAPLVLAQTLDGAGALRPLFAPLAAVAGEGALGLVVVELDPDRVARRYRARFASEAGTLPTLAGLMAAHLGLDPGDGHVNYGLGEPLSYIPMHELLEAEGSERDALREQLRGSAVLVGLTLPFEDVIAFPVPLSADTPSRVLPGVLLHAQALRSMMNGGLLRAVPALPLLGLALLLGGGLFAIRRPRWSGPASLVALAALWVASTCALTLGWVVPVATLSAAALIAVIARSVLEAGLAMGERHRLRQSFASSVSPAVMEAILDGRVTPDGRGERRALCLLFSDIRGFTSFSENRPAEEVIALLGEYFEAMTEVVHRHDGTVVSFMGDGLMCFFGAPASLPNPSLSAFDAARDMLEELSRLNASLQQRGQETVAIGIGLHYGEAMVGHVGSSSRADYTAIGDAVNVAARIEGLTKDLGYPVLVSEPVAEAIGHPDDLVALGEQAIKGRAPVTVFGWRPG